MPSELDDHRSLIRANVTPDEGEAVSRLVAQAGLGESARAAISARAAELVRKVRGSSDPRLMEVFLAEYGLSTGEGVALMCLAEALLRVPDAETIDDLIRDKIAPHDWSAHAGGSGSVFVNASTWALMLTGRVLEDGRGGVEGTLRAMVRRLGEPVIRRAVSAAMREMGEQFVLGETIAEALRKGRTMAAKGYLYSYDMLGEAARTEQDAQRYLKAYADAIRSLAPEARNGDIRRNPGISVKLSALHPRYEQAKRTTMLPQIAERLLSLCEAAKTARMGLNIDAEEADRLDLSLDVIEQVLASPQLAGWDGFGVVVQACGPRAAYVIDWLSTLAERLDRRIMVRLVKGAYWDSEIKRVQVQGLPGYPVFTRKINTDMSYIANARKLLAARRIYPQFATHNAHSVAAVLHLAQELGVARDDYEFQRLHGMGEALHEQVRRTEGTACRIYAPVGAHEDLLAYLVRRLLENGANSSFVHQIVDDEVSPEEIARDPFAAHNERHASNPAIPKPSEIFLPQRANSLGYDLSDPWVLTSLQGGVDRFGAPHQWVFSSAPGVRIVNPAPPAELVGTISECGETDVADAVGRAKAAFSGWASTQVGERSRILVRAADLFEANTHELLALCIREAGKTLPDAVAELREAVDFLHYYPAQAPAAEAGSAPRGVIGCISPWNFPLAIFTGQIAAALATGNTVVAKPAEQTPLIAARAVALLHEAGIPADVLKLVIGDGRIGGALTAEPGIAGICFTGSTAVARLIERQLAETAAPDAMLIAETGGLNAMIVDSTALPEQAVRDILASAFQSAGQRCSALRILYVQKDVEPKVLAMLRGALETLAVGDPGDIATDVGPLIDDEALQSIRTYCGKMEAEGRLVAKLDASTDGRFLGPHIVRVAGIEEMEREIFGPVLHVATFQADEIDAVIDRINAKGYGLTFGLHTRIDARVQHIVDRVHSGNVYINRNQIGAVVGSQPFGGEGLSGTGPKAGGPLYLARFRRVEGRSPDRISGLPGENLAAATIPSSAPADLPAFPDAGLWSRRGDRIDILRKLLRGKAAAALAAAASFEAGPIDLPGPTGEANSWAALPRGRVLVMGPSPDAFLSQTVEALAMGNAVIAFGTDATKALAPLRDSRVPLAIADRPLANGEAERLDADVVAFAGPATQASGLRRALASREGPIVRLVTELIAPAAYVKERSICVDTTAAGGNASLLAAADG